MPSGAATGAPVEGCGGGAAAGGGGEAEREASPHTHQRGGRHGTQRSAWEGKMFEFTLPDAEMWWRR